MTLRSLYADSRDPPLARRCLNNVAVNLVLEAEVPHAAGSVLHLYAVACYNLQHPDTMRLTDAALRGLAQNLADELAGRATLAEIRLRTRRSVNGATRVPTPDFSHPTSPLLHLRGAGGATAHSAF